MALLRVLTYNLQSLGADAAAAARVVRQVRPDVLVAQEAPRRLRWRVRCAAFARECEMLYVAGGRSAGGNLLLVTPRVQTSILWERRIPQPSGEPMRGVLAATLGLGPARIGVVGVHLGLRARGRALAVRHVLRAVRLLDGLPTVIAGDFNEAPGGSSWRAVAEGGFPDPCPDGSPTFPAGAPHSRIDAVLSSAAVGVKSYGVPEDPELSAELRRGSDHLPVLAVLDVPD